MRTVQLPQGVDILPDNLRPFSNAFKNIATVAMKIIEYVTTYNASQRGFYISFPHGHQHQAVSLSKNALRNKTSKKALQKHYSSQNQKIAG